MFYVMASYDPRLMASLIPEISHKLFDGKKIAFQMIERKAFGGINSYQSEFEVAV